MSTHSAFSEFLKLLREAKCDFVVVGGYAVAFHGHIRATQDIDLFFRNTPANVTALRSALAEFGLPTTEEQRRDFSAPGSILRLGLPPTRIELLNEISGIPFDEAWANRVPGLFGDIEVDFISLPDLRIWPTSMNSVATPRTSRSLASAILPRDVSPQTPERPDP